MDGNVYQTVQIGSQLWMAENLRVLHYDDGSNMQIKIGSFTINFGAKGTLYYPADTSSNADLYGGLYNFHCVDTDKLCPSSWRIPINTDWQILADKLGGSLIAGSDWKKLGTDTRSGPNTGACKNRDFQPVLLVVGMPALQPLLVFSLLFI